MRCMGKRLIDAGELLEWAEMHKILSKNYVPYKDGKFYYAIDYPALKRKINALCGVSEKEEVMQDEGEA